MKKRLIVITGPTASGKSALAVSLAKCLETEIISADSRQIYRGIPIVTAVPTEEEREGITHHLLEYLPLDAYYSASKFQEDATVLLDKIFYDRDYAIVCGGSMMYIDALVNGIDDIPTVPFEVRSHLMDEWKKKGDNWLIEQLYQLDREYYRAVDLKNFKRVFHAIEISLTAEKPYSQLLSGRENLQKDLPFDVVKYCLTGERNFLFDRINRRVEKMIKEGLEAEAQRVYHLRHLNSLNTVGLKEMFQFMEGKMDLNTTIARIQKNTRVYAKKQLTWHKKDNKIHFLDFMEPNKKIVDVILKMV